MPYDIIEQRRLQGAGGGRFLQRIPVLYLTLRSAGASRIRPKYLIRHSESQFGPIHLLPRVFALYHIFHASQTVIFSWVDQHRVNMAVACMGAGKRALGITTIHFRIS